eukprot:GILJ01015384.1.p1 GENE.GILJ01015384.1~~GILJ01015384.1.p1  ORF type:complete len:171 (-),score=44.47 GILJ01015384.1:219-731(-)
MFSYRSPFDEFFALHDRMNRLMDQAWSEEPFSSGVLSLEDTKEGRKEDGNKEGQIQTRPTRSHRLSLNLSETENGYRVTAEVPGVNKEDIKLNIENNVLSIEAEKRHEKKEDTETFHRIERSYGKFYRSLRLPENCNLNQVDAKYVDGVLTVDLGKKAVEAPRAKQIAIQ